MCFLPKLTKPITGHCLGATAALEAILSVMAIKHQVAPPSANCKRPDSKWLPGLVTGPPRVAILEHALSISLGFWGHLAALVFSRHAG